MAKYRYYLLNYMKRKKMDISIGLYKHNYSNSQIRKHNISMNIYLK